MPPRLVTAIQQYEAQIMPRHHAPRPDDDWLPDAWDDEEPEPEPGDFWFEPTDEDD